MTENMNVPPRRVLETGSHSASDELDVERRVSGDRHPRLLFLVTVFGGLEEPVHHAQSGGSAEERT